MHRIMLYAGVGLLLLSVSPARGAAQEIPMPTEWSTHYVWTMVPNPEYVAQPKEAEAAITAAHIQYQLRLVKEGKAIAGGGFAPSESDATIGLTILRAASLEEAQAIASEDPAVKAGRWKLQIRTWWVPTAQMP